MSQNWQQPPQQPGGYGYPQQPQQPGYGQPQAPYGGGFPPPPPPAPQGNAGMALLAGLAVAVVGMFAYGFLMSAMTDTDEIPVEVTQFSYAGIAVSALIGLVIGKLGGRNSGLWVVGAIFAAAAVFFGELWGYACIQADLAEGTPGAPGAFEIFTDYFSDNFETWKKNVEGLTYVFIALAPVAAFGTAYRVANSR
ncbi:hypothetical protein [Streptomyces sp. XD-27]|uniref:hypothetical protein n=1 Tax=Streptomyces sp. XD-27 TaxID=3062779 RepID=UPI0026F4781E|nr:hypothetical protein [Streptomyces sp. XD-27]WKX72064.1 hypothetical protein Q3Y56_21075 [Streptomyces sp. XD-27]